MANVIDGSRFRQARIQAGHKTQKALAKKVGVAENTIGRIERGQLSPSDRLLSKLTACLACDVRGFLVPDGTPATEADLIFFCINKLPSHHQDFMHALAIALAENESVEPSIQAARVYSKVMNVRRRANDVRARR